MKQYTYPVPPSSSLPVGAATEAKQDATNTKLDTIITKDFATSAKQDSTNTKLDTLIAKDFSTSAKQDTTNTKLDTLIAKDYATSAKQDTTNTKLDSVIANTNHLNVVDQIDTTPLLDTSSSNIPASANPALKLVDSLAANVKKIVSVEDIGEFLGLYSDNGTTLLCILPLGGGEIDITLPAGSKVYIRNMKNSAINTGMIALNFLG